MDEELKQVSDYFESWQLAELLSLSSEELVAAFEDEVLDKLDDLKELMGINAE